MEIKAITEIETLSISMENPERSNRLARLATILRDRSLWPDGFNWYYGDCKTCAMGLAVRTIDAPDIYDGWHVERDFSRFFELDYNQTLDIFYLIPGLVSEIMPEDVADKIDIYIKSSPSDHLALEEEMCD